MSPKKGVLQEIEAKSGSFALAFLLLFGLTFGFLALVGATPDGADTTKDSTLALNGRVEDVQPVQDQTQGTAVVDTQTQTQTQVQTLPPTGQSGVLPTRISIKKIGLNVTIANPVSSDISVLDAALLKGGVRYPTSGTLGINGTVLLFGHSSYLPVVRNQAYKAFDGIQNLQTGDIVSVYAGAVEYQFSVTGVRVADANSDKIELPQDAQHLTLVTCDSFASKSNRFVVTADFVRVN